MVVFGGVVGLIKGERACMSSSLNGSERSGFVLFHISIVAAIFFLDFFRGVKLKLILIKIQGQIRLEKEEEKRGFQIDLSSPLKTREIENKKKKKEKSQTNSTSRDQKSTLLADL